VDPEAWSQVTVAVAGLSSSTAVGAVYVTVAPAGPVALTVMLAGTVAKARSASGPIAKTVPTSSLTVGVLEELRVALRQPVEVSYDDDDTICHEPNPLFALASHHSSNELG
jgi:hypothetical protein